MNSVALCLEFPSRSTLSFADVSLLLTSCLAPRVAPVRSLFTVSRKQERLILFREAILHEIKDFGKRRQIRSPEVERENIYTTKWLSS